MKRLLFHPWFVSLPLAVSCLAQAQPSLSGLNPGVVAVVEPVAVSVNRVATTSGRVDAEIVFAMPPSVHVYRADTLFFRIADDTSWGVDSLRIEMPPPHPYRNIDGSMVDVIVDGQKVRLSRTIRDSAWGFAATLQYQACDSTKCFTPRRVSFRFSSMGNDTVWNPDAAGVGFDASFGGDWRALADRFTITGKAAGYLDAAKFLQFLADPAGFGRAGDLAGKSLWLIVLLVLLGGVALNLTPCVLPVIPITLAVIGAGAQAGSRGRGFLVGGIYGLGMALAYGVLGVVVATTGAQFGAINASPAFNLAIAAVFIVLALAMFGVLQIDFTKFRSGIRHDEKKRGSLLVAFVMGMIAAILAGACVAPVVISVVLYAARLYADGQAAGLLLPFLLGAGMALPWPFAGAGMSFLPKPGKWMTWVKYAFGALILAIAVWYGFEGVKLLRAPTIEKAASADVGKGNWITSLEEGLAVAAQEGRPALVDFWATWCKNCLAMDATTLRDPAVAPKLGDFVIVKFQAENPRDPAVKEILDYFGVVGLPAYVVLTPQSP